MPDINRLKSFPTAKEVAEIVSNFFQIPIPNLQTSKQRQHNIPRIIAIFLAKRFCVNRAELGNFFSLKKSSLGVTLKRCELFVKTSKDYQNIVNQLMERLMSNVKL